MELVDHIVFLLHRHNCVIVPGLGGFVGEYRPARIHPGNNEFLPPSKSVAFNPRLDRSDGLLADHLVQRTGLIYREAELEIEHFARRCHQRLQMDRTLVLSGLGKLIRDEEAKLRFIPEEGENFLGEAFGLRSFQASPVLRDKVQAIERGIEATAREKEAAREYARAGRTIITVGEDTPVGDRWPVRTWLYVAASVLLLFGVYQTLLFTEVLPGSQVLWLGNEQGDELEEGVLFEAKPLIPNLIKAMADLGPTTALSSVAPAAVVASVPVEEVNGEADLSVSDAEPREPIPGDNDSGTEERSNDAFIKGAEPAESASTAPASTNKTEPESSAGRTGEIAFSHGELKPQRGYYLVIGSYGRKALAFNRLEQTTELRENAGLAEAAVLKGHNGFYRAGIFVDEVEANVWRQLTELRTTFSQPDAWILKY